MRGDELQPSAADGGEIRERKGPRHAAPRKSLLTKLHLPATKAVALAAMPTAVFVGMGLTPKLALADNKDIPFAPGPCVTRSDEPVEEETPKPDETAKPTPTPSASQSAEPEPEPTAGETAGADSGEPAPAESAAVDAAEQQKASEEPAPAPSETRNPLDPLGVGEALKDLFDGIGKEKEPEATPTPSASTTPAEEPSQPAEEPSEKPSEKPADPADAAKDAIKDAADKAGATVEELDEDAKGLEPRKDEEIPEGAKPRFPCPTADPEALAAAELEPGIPLLPDEPWILETSMLTLTGLDYHGIVEVKTGSGKVKKVLKFTADGVDIKDLHQITEGPNGTKGHVEARSGSTSTIRGGTVTMYTEELKGNLFGIIPITFSPESPPPLNVPFAMFTNAKVRQAGQFGGTLTVPGLHNYIEK
ncbi:hypothetical protein AB0957_06980 [Streptomyces zhihengii]|uniref:hypothetical protein n=1 Tax=Streptomyces zhihengii TaxID=1818004 RepID=UPI0034543565